MIGPITIGSIVSGVYWTWRDGVIGPKKPFRDGKVIGHNRFGKPIIEVKSGNFVFKVSQTIIEEVR